jgi:hypothetical protein
MVFLASSMDGVIQIFSPVFIPGFQDPCASIYLENGDRNSIWPAIRSGQGYQGEGKDGVPQQGSRAEAALK